MFAFRLALALGYPHPDILLAMLTPQQFDEWIAYWTLEPFGYETEWQHAGVVASVIANVHRKKHSRSYKPSDFIPKVRKAPKKQTVKEMIEQAKLIELWARKTGRAKKKD